MSAQDEGYIIALEEAKAGAAEGGIPVGSAIVAQSGAVLCRGRNMRVQNGSHILHGETAAFDDGRKLNKADFEGSTLYTTLSPCPMCAGAMMWFKVGKVVIGENAHMSGREELLRSAGIEVVVLDDQAAKDVLATYIRDYPEIWSGV